MSADIREIIEQIRAGLPPIPARGTSEFSWQDRYAENPAIRSDERSYIARCSPENIRRLLEHIAELEARTEWRDMESAPKDEEVLIAYWRWRNSMSPGSVVVQSAMLTEHHGKGIWSWVVSDNKHGPFPIRGWSDGDLLGWMPLPARPTQERT